MADAAKDIKTYEEAATLCREDELLLGCTLRFPDYGQLVVTGDLHGHARNFEKLQRFCNLEFAGARHVILHELIHEELKSFEAVDTSHRLLLKCARWKCEFPEQVHFLMGNHELAQFGNHEITKNGRAILRDFEVGVAIDYGKNADRVMEAIVSFLGTMAMAARTPNRVFISHSLPSPRHFPAFDPNLFDRTPTPEDLQEHGSAYLLVWGRYQTENELLELSRLLDVDFFICGHQPQEMGYEVIHERMVILASDHNHGVFLPLDLAKPVTMPALEGGIKKFSGVV